MTLQEAKDQIAKNHGYEDWESVDWYKFDEMNQTTERPYGYESCYNQAAELYARSKWDEAFDYFQELSPYLFETKPEFKP